MEVINQNVEDVNHNFRAAQARLDAIEKPVKGCGRCGGGGVAYRWDAGVCGLWGEQPCPHCNGTGRED